MIIDFANVESFLKEAEDIHRGKNTTRLWRRFFARMLSWGADPNKIRLVFGAPEDQHNDYRWAQFKKVLPFLLNENLGDLQEQVTYVKPSYAYIEIPLVHDLQGYVLAYNLVRDYERFIREDWATVIPRDGARLVKEADRAKV